MTAGQTEESPPLVDAESIALSDKIVGALCAARDPCLSVKGAGERFNHLFAQAGAKQMCDPILLHEEWAEDDYLRAQFECSTLPFLVGLIAHYVGDKDRLLVVVPARILPYWIAHFLGCLKPELNKVNPRYVPGTYELTSRTVRFLPSEDFSGETESLRLDFPGPPDAVVYVGSSSFWETRVLPALDKGVSLRRLLVLNFIPDLPEDATARFQRCDPTVHHPNKLGVLRDLEMGGAQTLALFFNYMKNKGLTFAMTFDDFQKAYCHCF